MLALSSLEEILESYADAIETLQTLSHLRTPPTSTPSSTSTQQSNLIDPTLATSLDTLETLLKQVKSQLVLEQQALKEQEFDIIAHLDLTQRAMMDMLSHLPKHLPGLVKGSEPSHSNNKVDREAESGSKMEGHEVAGLGVVGGLAGSVSENETGVSGKAVKSDPHVHTTQPVARSSKPSMVTSIAPLTVSEFDSLPKYLCKQAPLRSFMGFEHQIYILD
jgi:hypothetical protein